MSTDPDDLLAALEDDFLVRYRRGDNPALDDYAARHPELAERIRDRFTAAVALERAQLTSDEGSAPLATGLPSIPDYEIVREVGRGGMGVVFEAVHLELQRHVALKVLQLGNLIDPQRVARFKQEARVVAGLQHANIVPVYDTGLAEGLHFYTMLYIRGASLDHIIDDLKKGKPGAADSSPPLPGLECTASTVSGWPFFRSVARLGIQAAEALQHAHAHGVLHRDVKPSNLMIDERGNVWLTDFGLARALDSDSGLSEAGAIPPGTLAYSPPERFEGRHDARSDLYALGLTLYELVSQRRAHDATNPVQLLKQVRDASPPPLSKLVPRIPRDLETIINKTIDPDPGRRYPSAGELAADLQRFLEDRPIRARRISALAHFWRRCRRHPGVTLLLCSLFLALLTGLILWGYVNHQATQLLQARQQNEERERRQLEDQLHALRVSNAEKFAAHGSWPQALQQLDQAIADDRADRRSLEVARLRGLFAVNDWAKLEKELEHLRRLPLKGPQRAAVLLAWGDSLFCDQARQSEAETAVRQALAARADLTPADAAYAEGLLAAKPKDKLRAFRQAIQDAPSHMHHRASGALCTTLLGLGRLDEARTEAAFMQRVYTEDALPAFLEAILDLLEGQRAQSLRKLETLAPKLGPERMRRLRTLFTELAEVLTILERVNARFGVPDLGDIVSISGRAVKISSLSGQAMLPLGFVVPTVWSPFNRFSVAARAFLQMQLGSPDTALKTLDLEADERPDVYYLFLALLCHTGQWHQAQRSGDVVAARALLTRIARLAQQAQTAPTILPRLSFRYQALVLGTMAECTLIIDHKVKDPALRAQLRQDLQRLVTEGRKYPQLRGPVLSLLVPALEPELGRYLLGSWQLEQPDDDALLRLRANLEMRDGNYNAALKIAGERLRKKPKDKEWQKMQDEATAGLRKSVEALPTP